MRASWKGNDQIVFGAQGTAQDTMYSQKASPHSFHGLDIIHGALCQHRSAVDLYHRGECYTIDPGDVIEGIWGGKVRDEYINILPF